MQKSGFKFKAFTSFSLTIAFIISALSGVMLYIAPRGRTANWNAWSMWGFEKGEWEALHILAVILLLVLGLFHLLYFNWKVFKAYLIKRHQPGIQLKKELITATVFVGIIIAGTIYEVPPFSTVIAYGDEIKDYWESNSVAPPIPHAESLTLTEFSDQVLDVNVQKVLQVLRQHNLEATGSERISDLAEQNNLAPVDIYEMLTQEINSKKSVGDNVGYGNMNFSEVCQRLDISVAEAIDRLKQHDIIVDNPQENVRLLASRYNQKPYNLIQVLSTH